MMLSLAIALLLAATLGVDAAPQAKSGQPEATKIAQMVMVSGKCTKLVHAGVSVGGCKPILMNLNYSTGVSAYWFMTDGTILSFSGDGSRQVEQDPEVVVQAVEKVIRAATIGVLREEDTQEGDCHRVLPPVEELLTERAKISDQQQEAVRSLEKQIEDLRMIMEARAADARRLWWRRLAG